jgi:hypothetical protein
VRLFRRKAGYPGDFPIKSVYYVPVLLHPVLYMLIEAFQNIHSSPYIISTGFIQSI